MSLAVSPARIISSGECLVRTNSSPPHSIPLVAQDVCSHAMAHASILTNCRLTLPNVQVSFIPNLPDAKLAAIRSMGMGTLNKVVLHFPGVFWEQVDFLGHAGKDRRKWLLFVDMSRVTNQPVLVAMTGGPFALLVERLCDAEVIRRAMAVIRNIHPDAPDPVASQVTRWKADKFSRGSFSFIPPGCR